MPIKLEWDTKHGKKHTPSIVLEGQKINDSTLVHIFKAYSRISLITEKSRFSLMVYTAY